CAKAPLRAAAGLIYYFDYW
nr:immunoglobulin heavy chain junction region [Macaca mulatta]